ncbi:MAG: glycosyltransferase family 4 protein [Bacteroidetes bacterium]|nr:glycosyltransferase family 4 protein [Bacteroidota bacterium]
MNILYLCDEYPPGRHGGIGTAVQLLARAMVKLGHKVVVAGFYDWGYGGPDEFEDEGVKVYRFRRGLDSSFFSKKDALPVRAAYKFFYLTSIFQKDLEASIKRYAVYLENIIEKHQIDIVEQPDFNEYAQYCRKPVFFPRLSVPTVVKLHGSISYFVKEEGCEPSPVIYKIDSSVLNSAVAVSSVSGYTARKTAAYMAYTKPIDTLYNGIESRIVTNAVKDNALVIYTGSLVAKKGIYQLMKAWNKVQEMLPAARLEVYGKGPVNRIKKYLSPKALTTVDFKGHIPRADLFNRLAAASVAVFPSYAECFALGPMEAMAVGTATIYSTRTSGPELITNGLDGLLADPDDADALAGKIMELLRNPEENSRIAAAGKKKVHERFDINVIAKGNEAFYRSVLGR